MNDLEGALCCYLGAERTWHLGALRVLDAQEASADEFLDVAGHLRPPDVFAQIQQCGGVSSVSGKTLVRNNHDTSAKGAGRRDVRS